MDGQVMATTTSIKLVIPSRVRFVDLAHTAAEKMAALRDAGVYIAPSPADIGILAKEVMSL